MCPVEGVLEPQRPVAREAWQDTMCDWAGECQRVKAAPLCGADGQVGAGPHGFPFSHPYQAGTGIPNLHWDF